MTRKKTVRKLKKDTWDMFSRYIRLRDSIRTTGTKTRARCITCGKEKEWKWMDAGHWKSRRHNTTLFHERNVHAQCKGCNKYGNGKPTEYEEAIIKMYGKSVRDEIVLLSKQTKKFTRRELEDLLQHYKKAFKELEET